MKAIEPRATTGTLEELMPVAPFTTPFGLIVGVGWARNSDAMYHKHMRHLAICNHIVLAIFAFPDRQNGLITGHP
jgi:hypothetical protein